MTVQYQGVWSLQSAAQLQSTQRWVTDPLFDYTTLLLQADDAVNGAQNNTFLDSSSNAFAITRNGNTTQGSFTPFSQAPGYWSNYFDGTGDYLLTALTGRSLGTGSFTVQCYFNISVLTSGYIVISSTRTGGGADGTSLTVDSATQKITITTSGSVLYTGRTVIKTNQWYHLAYVRNGSSACSVYIDGVLDGTFTDARNFSGTQLLIGGGEGGNAELNGYISNYSITNTAVYTAAFTPPNTPTTSAVVILTCQSNRFVDNSGNNFTFTIGGTPSIQAFSPFAPQFQWTPSVIGGSGYFDGSGDYLSVPSSSNLAFGTGDFCVEFWLYRTGTTGGIYSNSVNSGGGDAQFEIQLNGTNKVILIGWNTTFMTGATTINANTWYHIAVVRSGTSMAIFVNGARDATATSANNFSSLNAFVVGVQAAGSGPTTGYISNLRSVKGAFVYNPSSTTVTIPTAPLTAITNTQLLLNFTNAGIYDGTMKNNLETAGNAQVSTAVVKYGSGSMAFDGSGDYLVVGNMFTTPNLALLAGDFTIEYWYYPLNTGIHASLNNLDDNAGNGSLWILMNGTFSGGSKVQLGYNTGGANANILFGSGTFAINQWYHIAITRQGPAIRCFINGVQEGSTNTGIGTGSIGAYNRNLVIGATLSGGSYTAYNLNGYLDDFRLTKGIARYTQNFIPPSVALPRQ